MHLTTIVMKSTSQWRHNKKLLMINWHGRKNTLWRSSTTSSWQSNNKIQSSFRFLRRIIEQKIHYSKRQHGIQQTYCTRPNGNSSRAHNCRQVFFSEATAKNNDRSTITSIRFHSQGRAKQFIIPRVPNDFEESNIPEPHERQSECTTGSKYVSQDKQCTIKSSQAQVTAFDTNLKDANRSNQVNRGQSPTILSNTNDSMDFCSNEHVDYPMIKMRNPMEFSHTSVAINATNSTTQNFRCLHLFSNIVRDWPCSNTADHLQHFDPTVIWGSVTFHHPSPCVSARSHYICWNGIWRAHFFLCPGWSCQEALCSLSY